MTRTAISLGSNLGDRLGNLRLAVERLSSLGAVVAVSSLYETDPIGGPEQGRYLNAVVLLDADLTPLDLLAALQEIERAAHRVRRERWGPRTLDLDIVAWDEDPVSLPILAVPHPRAAERRFVIEPLKEVWPEAIVAPGVTAAEAFPPVAGQKARRWEGEWTHGVPHLGPAAARWVAAQVVLFVVWGSTLVVTADTPPDAWRAVAGGSLAAIAVGLGTSAVLTLGRELTPYPQPRAGASLVARGPYRLVRHPIYGSIVLGFGAVSVAFGSVAALAVSGLLAMFFRAKAEVEEHANAIGIPGYGGYLGAVRRRFIPFVW